MGAAVPPLVMACVSAFFAAQYLAIYLRTRRPPELLGFVYAALAVSLYDALAAVVYATAGSPGARIWEYAQIVALAVVSVAMIRFISDHTGYPCGRWVAAMCAGYGAAATIAVVAGNARLAKLSYAVAMTGFVWIALAVRHLVRAGARDRAVRLLSFGGLLLAAAVNDLLLVLHVVRSIFILEYVLMAAVVLMADSLAVELAKAVRTEDALRDSEVRYRTLFESATDAILLLRDGRVVECNERTLAVYGCARDEMLGRGPADYSPAFQRDGSWSEPAAKEHIAAALAGAPQRFEWLHTRKDGTLFVAEISLNRVEMGGDAFVLAVVRDITERKQAEDESFRSRQMLQSVLDNIPQRVFWKDRNFRFLGCNRAFARDAGLASPDEVVGKDDFKLTWRASAPLYRADDAHVMGEDAAKIGFEEPQERADGSRRWLRTSKVALHDASGKVVGILGTYEDITDRKAAEEALRASEQRFRSLVETTSDWVWETDASGRYVYSSPKVEDLLGYRPEDVLGKTPFDLMPKDEAERVGALVAGPMAARRPVVAIENVNVRIDGRLVVLETSGVPVFADDGAFLGYRGIDRDVTERRRVEEQLQQAQRMDAIGNLAGGVAHDFNNLLQAMLTDTLLLRERAADAGGVRERARHLEEEIARGGALTRQLLVFSRRETTRSELLDLNEVVRGATSLLRRLLRENIQLSVELAPGPLQVAADHGQLDQVLMNLAVNAADAMPGGGRLTITTGATDGQAWLEAADTGCGIADEVRGRIFEPFFTTKGAGKGTGLGLAVVHGIVTRHGGTVSVVSRPGAGAVFTVRLPLARACDRAVAPRATEPAAWPDRRGGRSILVVEDEEGVRNGLVEILRTLEYRVTAAGSSADALRIAERDTFDLVLCDLLLPDGSGSEVVSGLLARHPSVRVVLMSGYAKEEAVRLGVTEGKVRFLQKPFDATTLARELDAAMAGTT